MVPKEIKEYVRGLYGASPAPISDEIRTKIIGNEKVITVRPADLLEPELEKYKEEVGQLATSLEDVLSYALFPQVAKKFFENRLEGSAVAAELEKNSAVKSDTREEEIHYITVTM
ncbi:hypothetical protein SDC9_116323 [bioreactor metagenome]|uniref:Carboxylase conserved domain-containing protein n=1 Tax=bioreactor metagenome TaxID=1076179 RepID=A0A645BW99_9ZZZZ